MVAVVKCACGADVPDEHGPLHPYMGAEAGCWRCFGDLQARLLEGGKAISLVADTYAAQHPANAGEDRRQRQSIAVHLVALCLHLAHGVPEDDLDRHRVLISARVLPSLGESGWPMLTPPTTWGPWNAVSLLALPTSVLQSATQEWTAQVWAAWAAEHSVVEGWSARVLGGGQP